MKIQSGLVAFAVLIMTLAAGAEAQVQRMGLLPSSTTIESSSEPGSLPSRCLDEDADPPLTNHHYSQVLTQGGGGNRARVTRGDRTIPLQEALDLEWISITGMTSLNDALVTGRVTFDRLRIINHTDEPITVRIRKSIVIGTKDHESFRYDGIEDLLTRRFSQDEVWERQEQLSRLDTIEQTERAQTQWLSTEKMQLFSVTALVENRFVRSVRIILGNNTVELTTREFELLSRGEGLPSDHPLSVALADTDRSFVLDTTYLGEKASINVASRSGATAEQLVLNLQRAYPDANIFRDPLSDETSKSVAALRDTELSSPRDILVIGSEESFGVEDWATVANAESQLVEAGIQGPLWVDKGSVSPPDRGTGAGEGCRRDHRPYR